jgi:hypothetical protein
VCGKPECQRERRKRKQAEWRAEHPGYFRAIRLRKRSNEAEAAEEAMEQPSKKAGGVVVKWPSPLRVPKILSEVPWELAQSKIGVQATDFIVVTALLILRLVQSQRRLQSSGNKKDTRRLGADPDQSQREPVSG